jgi:hypothetical protein
VPARDLHHRKAALRFDLAALAACGDEGHSGHGEPRPVRVARP